MRGFPYHQMITTPGHKILDSPNGSCAAEKLPITIRFFKTSVSTARIRHNTRANVTLLARTPRSRHRAGYNAAARQHVFQRGAGRRFLRYRQGNWGRLQHCISAPLLEIVFKCGDLLGHTIKCPMVLHVGIDLQPNVFNFIVRHIALAKEWA